MDEDTTYNLNILSVTYTLHYTIWWNAFMQLYLIRCRHFKHRDCSGTLSLKNVVFENEELPFVNVVSYLNYLVRSPSHAEMEREGV